MTNTWQSKDTLRLKERIHFDPFAAARAKHERLPVIQIPSGFWGKLEPIVKKITYTANSPLPKADVLIVTWTTAETQALSAVFTSTHDFATSWYSYKNGFAAIKSKIPAAIINEKANKDSLKIGILGFFNIVTLNGKTVVLFKSELHPADDGVQLPVVDLIKQLVAQAAPQLLITTGTAGAIGSYLRPGDAVITEAARFYLTKPKTYALYPAITDSLILNNTVKFNNAHISYCNSNATGLIKSELIAIAKKNGYAPISRTPQIFFNNVPGASLYDAVSSNGFSMDDVNDTDGLQQLGIFNEMDDAFVAFALSLGNKNKIPNGISVRNMSEPQAPNLSEATKTKWKE